MGAAPDFAISRRKQGENNKISVTACRKRMPALLTVMPGSREIFKELI
jgi:hypothetical protein